MSTAVPNGFLARITGIKTEYKPGAPGEAPSLPMRIAVVAQGATAKTYPTTKFQTTSHREVGALMGFGSPAQLVVSQLLPDNGDGVASIPVTVYPQVDAVTATTSVGNVEASGTPTRNEAYRIVAGNIRSAAFTIAKDQLPADTHTAIIAAVNANVQMPVIAAAGTSGVDLTAKWAGSTGDDIVIAVEGATDAGTTFAITQPTGGAVDPDMTAFTGQVGQVWDTLVLDSIATTDTFDELSTFNEGRWNPLTYKPFVAFHGYTGATVSGATTITDARPTDRTNCRLVSPGSNDLPFMVAARQLARIAARANDNPPYDYGSMAATGLTPGPDNEQWTPLQRNEALTKGCSSVEVKNPGEVQISDIVTMYHPAEDGELAPFRYVVDIVKLMNVIYNMDQVISGRQVDGVPIVPDDQPVRNPKAIKPKTIKSDINARLDLLGNAAILADVESSKALTQVWIDGTNPKRTNSTINVKLSGNNNVKSLDIGFGFYFGQAPEVG